MDITYLNVLLLLTLHFYGCESSMEIVWGLFFFIGVLSPTCLQSRPCCDVTPSSQPLCRRQLSGEGTSPFPRLRLGIPGTSHAFFHQLRPGGSSTGIDKRRQIMNFVKTTVRKHSILRLTNRLPLAELRVFFSCYYLCMICFVFILEVSPAFFIQIVALESVVFC